MRFLPLAILLVWLAGGLPGLAQETAIKTFDGSNSLTTGLFNAPAKWEVRWNSPDVIAITVVSQKNTIVAGTAGSSRGSLFLPRAGAYYLQIHGPAAAWHVSIVCIGKAKAVANTPPDANYAPPNIAIAGESGAGNSEATAAPPPEAAPSIPAPAPPTTPTPSPTPSVAANPVAGNLTGDQADAIVVIKGDVAEGTGFLVRTADGPAVVTNLHVISANPNIKILTTTGKQVKTLSLKGASDRDLAMFMIQDDHYTYLQLATDVQNTARTGDEVITPGNSEGGEVVLDTKGTLLGIGPDRVEFSNPVYHGNSGGPVFHTNSGKVLAVVTQAMRVNTSSAIDKASFENKSSAITGPMRYFGFRLDTVPKWETYDWNRFLGETTFLKNFEEQSRCLDSYMNGASYEKAHLAGADEDGPPNSQYFLRNQKIVTARDNYRNQTVDADNSQKLDASREMVMDLEGLSDTNMDSIQNPANFYSFDELRAAQEIKYRKALRAEIEKFGDKISDLGH